MAFWHRNYSTDIKAEWIGARPAPPLPKVEEPKPEPTRSFRLGIACPEKHARSNAHGEYATQPIICPTCGKSCKQAVVSGVFWSGLYGSGWSDVKFHRWLNKSTTK